MFKIIKKYFSYDHKKYENILDSDNKIWIFCKNFIFWLVLFFALVLIFESIWDNEIKYYKELFFIDAFISSIFAIEYYYRISRAKSKIKFIINPMRIIDLLSFLPFFLWIIAIWDFLKILRLFRIFRILRVIKKIPLTNDFIKALKDYREEYKAVFILFLIILFIGSFFVYFAEKNVIVYSLILRYVSYNKSLKNFCFKFSFFMTIIILISFSYNYYGFFWNS